MATSMVVIKRFPYRTESEEEWSNRYFLDGSDPADNAAWLALGNALMAAEKTLYGAEHLITRLYGYTNDSPTAHAVYTRDLRAQGSEVAGTYAGVGNLMPGDVAGWVRWKTDRVTSRGKPIYLRKYFHGARGSTTVRDELASPQYAAYMAFGALLSSGAGVDGRHIRGPGEADDVILAHAASGYLTTRTLKRRGRRPTSAP